MFVIHKIVLTKYANDILLCTVINSHAHPSDVEQEQAPLPCIWSEARTKLLISTYVDHEQEMESRKIKKKDVWQKIAKKRRVQRNKQSDENNITLQTLNFLKAAHEERKQLQMQSEANRDKRASERNALLNFWMF